MLKTSRLAGKFETTKKRASGCTVGAFPRIFGWIHDIYRTPWISVCVFSLVSFSFAATGSFAHLAVVSSMARLIFYGFTCASVPVLRRSMPLVGVSVVLPGGVIIPAIALTLCACLITGVSKTQALTGTVAFAFGAFVYAASARKTFLDTKLSNHDD
jgi:amino acid transporter